MINIIAFSGKLNKLVRLGIISSDVE
jgi:peroxiredoxin family protein